MSVAIDPNSSQRLVVEKFGLVKKLVEVKCILACLGECCT